MAWSGSWIFLLFSSCCLGFVYLFACLLSSLSQNGITLSLYQQIKCKLKELKENRSNTDIRRSGQFYVRKEKLSPRHESQILLLGFYPCSPQKSWEVWWEPLSLLCIPLGGRTYLGGFFGPFSVKGWGKQCTEFQQKNSNKREGNSLLIICCVICTLRIHLYTM